VARVIVLSLQRASVGQLKRTVDSPSPSINYSGIHPVSSLSHTVATRAVHQSLPGVALASLLDCDCRVLEFVILLLAR